MHGRKEADESRSGRLAKNKPNTKMNALLSFVLQGLEVCEVWPVSREAGTGALPRH